LGVGDALFAVLAGELRGWVAAADLGGVVLESFEATEFVVLIGFIHALWFAVTKT
jgi:hypothetical protein